MNILTFFPSRIMTDIITVDIVYKQAIYYSLALIHILIWIFVVFAFLNKDLAIINLSYVIPFIYILQILPLHILNTAKCYVNKNCDKDNKKIEKSIGFSYLKDLFKNSFGNPLSAQGLLILGAVLSFYKTKYSVSS